MGRSSPSATSGSMVKPSLIGILLALCLLGGSPSSAYQGGQTKNHNHTATAGQGGVLSALQINSGAKISSGTLILDGNGGGGTLQFGDGSSQSTAGAGLSSNNSFSQSNTFASTVTVTGPFTGGLSTSTTITGTFSVTGTADVPLCNITNSTITFTSRAVPLRLEFDGGITSGTGIIFLGFVLDGVFASTKLPSYTAGANYQFSAGGSINESPSMRLEIPAVTQGSHWLCIHAFNTVAATQLACGASSASPCQIRMKELTNVLASP